MAGYELHVISNGKQNWKAMAAISSKIQLYVTAIHIREKTMRAEEIRQGLKILLEAGVSPGSIYINGHPGIATAAKVGGTHLPGSSPPLTDVEEFLQGDMRAGVSVHSAEEALVREQEGADYLMFGHVFATGSKHGLPPRGLEQLREVTAKAAIPVIAIGGITTKRVRSVLEAGASGVAVMSGIWEAQDPLLAVRAYADELKGWR
ncbi:thiamine phosphate synthase [Paenibacillus sedimenti]|uniref:Thiamine phosphate synthase n=1 Tax=Paenibacillus sedimenti TaxID=2770274 RepID=A0A926KMD7_9BACL|nr:thiamine phosphate synthase [Paenibacillus sedimenti]MBD0379446.1 thiamine phosphate synthase [Paenibacillus sedimenti]